MMLAGVPIAMSMGLAASEPTTKSRKPLMSDKAAVVLTA